MFSHLRVYEPHQKDWFSLYRHFYRLDLTICHRLKAGTPIAGPRYRSTCSQPLPSSS